MSVQTRIYERVRELMDQGMQGGFAIFSADGSGGAYYTEGDSPPRQPGSIMVRIPWPRGSARIAAQEAVRYGMHGSRAEGDDTPEQWPDYGGDKG